jgi:hypothetical protein
MFSSTFNKFVILRKQWKKVFFYVWAALCAAGLLVISDRNHTLPGSGYGYGNGYGYGYGYEMAYFTYEDRSWRVYLAVTCVSTFIALSTK